MTLTDKQWQQCVSDLPLVAILRGVQPDEALSVGQVLVEAGFKIIEVPLNSPNPFDSIKALAEKYGRDVMIGAGTVLHADDVEKTVAAGGNLIVAPNFNQSVAANAVKAGCIYCPGVATPTEAFSAIDHGASALKLFPAEMITPSVVKAMRAVLPEQINLFAVGGIAPENMRVYVDAGCTGFGIGSALYQSGKSLADINHSAKKFVTALTR